jgi:hypothetical protein
MDAFSHNFSRPALLINSGAHGTALSRAPPCIIGRQIVSEIIMIIDEMSSGFSINLNEDCSKNVHRFIHTAEKAKTAGVLSTSAVLFLTI